MSPRFYCNRSGLHFNYYETKKLQENFLYKLAKLDWQFDMIGMYTVSKNSIRVTNENKCKKRVIRKSTRRTALRKLPMNILA